MRPHNVHLGHGVTIDMYQGKNLQPVMSSKKPVKLKKAKPICEPVKHLMQWEDDRHRQELWKLLRPIVFFLGIAGLYHPMRPDDNSKQGICYSVLRIFLIIYNVFVMLFLLFNVGLFGYYTQSGNGLTLMFSVHIIIIWYLLLSAVLVGLFFWIWEARLDALTTIWTKWASIQSEQDWCLLRRKVALVTCATVLLVTGLVSVTVLSVMGVLSQIGLDATDPFFALANVDWTLGLLFQINFAITQFYVAGITGFSTAFLYMWCFLTTSGMEELVTEVKVEVLQGSLWENVAVEVFSQNMSVLEYLRRKYSLLCQVIDAVDSSFNITTFVVLVAVFLMIIFEGYIFLGVVSRGMFFFGVAYIALMFAVSVVQLYSVLLSCASVHLWAKKPVDVFLKYALVDDQQAIRHSHQVSMEMFISSRQTRSVGLSASRCWPITYRLVSVLTAGTIFGFGILAVIIFNQGRLSQRHEVLDVQSGEAPER